MPQLFPEQVARARSHARRFPRPYWILLSGEAVQSLGYGLVVPFFALYLTDTIKTSATLAGAVLALWSVVAIAGHPIGGVLADRVGRRPVMMVGLGGSAAASFAFSTASSVLAVALLVLVWGFANSVFEPAAAAFVADVAPEDLRTEAFGLWRVVNNGFFSFGPPLAALLVWLWSLRATFVFAGIALAVYLLIAWRRLPETRPAPAEEDAPARWREALSDRLLVLLTLGTAAAAFMYSIFEGVLPVFVHEERGISVAQWGLIFAINPILVTLFQYPVSRWAGRRSSRAVLAGGSILIGVGLALIWPFASTVALALAIVVMSVGEMLHAPVSTAVAADLAPERLRGSYQGTLNLAWEGAWGPASLVGLWLVGQGHGEMLLAAAIPLGLVAALLFFALPGGRIARSETPIARADPAPP